MSKDIKIDNKLPLMESFYSVQGEGYFQGKAAYFIRLAGCDVGCVWCDVRESWDAAKSPMTSIRDIIAKASEAKSRIAIITGGEPLMYDLTQLTEALKKNGFDTHLETSGVHTLTGNWNWICFSPKKFKEPRPEYFEKADELKIVVYNKNDLLWGESMANKVKKWGCRLYFQPEWSKSEKLLPHIISYVKRNPHWEISLQIHKFMDIR